MLDNMTPGARHGIVKRDLTVTFSSSDRKAARDGILFALAAVDSAYAAGPIRYVTTNLLVKLGYLAPNAFGGRTISPQVNELFSAALEIFKKGEQAEPGDYPYVGDVRSPTGTHTVWISPNRAAGKHTLYLPEDWRPTRPKGKPANLEDPKP